MGTFKGRLRWLSISLVAFVAGVLPGGTFLFAADPKPKVQFNRQVRPALSNSCFACHGPDAKNRQADLRLDVREIAIKEVIVPGSAAKSPLVARITAKDPDERMPPADSRRPPLTPEQIALIKQWINEGAEYQPHWSFAPVVRPKVPEVADRRWTHSEIDRFVAVARAQANLPPSPEADRRTLLRRLSFDLTGLPPTPAEVAAFEKDKSADAYEKQVDRLLASPHFGERLAIYWLDVVRYADSGGYHSDNPRNVWLYRDYVIDAFNRNKPFSDFTVEQIAGDLLPGATREQKIASGYNRLLQTTEEGGAQPKEYTAIYAADRVRNTANSWLGVTLGCAQCHDHKYDPFASRDFYSFAAFFADVDELAVKRQVETPLPTPEEEAALKKIDDELAPLVEKFTKPDEKLDAAQAEWEKKLAEDEKALAKLPKNVAAAIKAKPEKRNEKHKHEIMTYFRGTLPELADVQKQADDLKRRRDAIMKEVPRSLVTKSVTPRVVRVLPRGNWQDDSGEVVEPAVPPALGRLEVRGRRATRLDLARWLVDHQNPLVARTLVNRLWRLYFGQGLARTVDDLGSQGTMPTHPDLLDWLAADLMDSGWDLKRTVREIVISQAYRQASLSNPEFDRIDPANVWLARQGRFRLDAELIRDNALAVSGLIVLKIGGPSVKPYQPAGYWSFLNFPKRDWEPDKGEAQYRRGLYTWWQRTFLHPSLLAFDACTREEATADRPRSNTPLQALTVLNDPTYVEAAKMLGVRMMRDGGRDAKSRVTFGYRAVLQREPAASEANILIALQDKQLKVFEHNQAAAKQLLAVGQAKVPEDLPAAELASWAEVARVILNLHETITRY